MILHVNHLDNSVAFKNWYGLLSSWSPSDIYSGVGFYSRKGQD